MASTSVDHKAVWRKRRKLETANAVHAPPGKAELSFRHRASGHKAAGTQPVKIIVSRN